jgi:hypothetical protein
VAAFVQFCRRRQKLTRPEEGMTERGEVTRSLPQQVTTA